LGTDAGLKERITQAKIATPHPDAATRSANQSSRNTGNPPNIKPRSALRLLVGISGDYSGGADALEYISALETQEELEHETKYGALTRKKGEVFFTTPYPLLHRRLFLSEESEIEGTVGG